MEYILQFGFINEYLIIFFRIKLTIKMLDIFKIKKKPFF